MPLHAASSGGDAQIIQHLLRPIRHQQQQYYAQQQQYQQQLHDYTSQQQLYYQGHFNNRGAVVDAEDSEGRTALHTAADLGHTQVLLQLLTAHPMLNKRDIDGATPLLLAATHGHQGAVKALTRAGCELDERNCEGRTALMEAVTASHTNIAQHLISCGCHVNVMDNHGYSALADAACAKDIRSVNLLLDGGADVDIQDSRGRTPLHLAILYGYNAIAQCLINANCQLNTQDMDGHTAVFLAAWDPWDKGTLPILDTLARAGADLNKSDLMGATPITKAWAHKENVITLIQHGCQVNLETQPNLQTPYGFSLVELAAMERDSRTVHALRVAGFDASVIDFSAKREKHQQEYDDLKKLFSSPLNLKDISRLTIRRHIKKHLHKKAKLLPLPTILKSYVCMKDL